jgi:hypothetical protein
MLLSLIATLRVIQESFKVEPLLDKRDGAVCRPSQGEPFIPIPFDTTGLPNVIHGCNGPLETTIPKPQIDEIQLHVITWRRPESLNTLLGQLEASDYKNWHKPVPLYIHIDGESDNITQELIKETRWSHGRLHRNFRKRNVGLRRMWLHSLGTAAENAGNNTLMIVFEDDVRVSLAYFQWTLAILNAYARNPDCRDSALVGFSLSPLRVMEMKKPFSRWDARDALGIRYNNDNRHLAYLTNVPSSWGAAYFSDRWQEFDKFVRIRMHEPFYNQAAEEAEAQDYAELKMSPPDLHIPDARSNVWPKSWKRFMVDFMYGRGSVMLYPCIPGEQGFATALQESGEHVNTRKRFSPQNPRVSELVQGFDLPSMGFLPAYGDLAVFGLFLKPSTREQLAFEGTKFLNSVWNSCKPCREKLVPLWAGLGANVPDRFDSSDPTPHICAADLFTPVSANRLHAQSPSASERYLLFEPQYGTNNQLHAVIQAYYWARALRRRLVLPPLFVPRVSDYIKDDSRYKANQWSEMSKYLQISDRDTDISQRSVFDASALEPIGITEFAKRNLTPWRMIRLTRDAVFDTAGRVLTKQVLGLEDLPIINLRSRIYHQKNSLSVEAIQHLFGGCDDQVLAFDGMYYANLVEINPRERLPDLVTLGAQAKKIYSKVKKKFFNEIRKQSRKDTNYACYHVRLGDFTDMCDKLENADEKSDIFKILPISYLRTVKEFSCSVSSNELSSAIAKNPLPVFVMTDSPLEVAQTLQDLQVFAISSDWTADAVREFAPRETSEWDLEFLSLLVDQHLCAESKFALLNRFSTVSQLVASLRRGKDFEFWKRELTNEGEQVASKLRR